MHLNTYREDLKKQKDGAPIYIGDSVFYVRRWGTPESLKVRRQLERELFSPFHKKIESDDSLLLAHWLAEYAVTNWENVYDDSGILEWSIDTARKVFLNPEFYLSLNQELFSFSMKYEHFLFDEVEDESEAIKKP